MFRKQLVFKHFLIYFSFFLIIIVLFFSFSLSNRLHKRDVLIFTIVCFVFLFSVYSPLQTSSDGNVTTSVLTFTPVIKDSDKTLSCRAETGRPENANHRHGKPVDRQPPPADVDSSDGWKMNIFRELPLFLRAYF